MLPQDFLERMERMLEADYPAFLESYEKERYRALRLNVQKADRETFAARAPFALTPVGWSSAGFYYGKEDAPGKHPWHDAGVYYIQEPSAMAPAEYLTAAVKEPEQERILDLCAAPGGKSTQIAAAMRGRGILVSNEIHPVRAKILSGNIERMGIANAMVTNETPQRLAEAFGGYFTGILVDAPCSGEGMFRKNEDACGEWSPANVKLCAARQDEILDCAAAMLAPGGRLVYSTCTFAPEENEGSVVRFLARHPEYAVEETERYPGMSSGVPEWFEGAGEDIRRTIRLWPHRVRGEGHYLAVLRKVCAGGGEREQPWPAVRCGAHALQPGLSAKDRKDPKKGCAEFLEFARGTLTEKAFEYFCAETNYLRFAEQLYRFPEGMPAVKGLRVLRPGLHLGAVRKNRFEPSHAFALALSKEQVRRTADFPADSPEIRRYLAGETFPCAGEKGWYLIAADGYGIGWGKLSGGVMKNHYPKGLRRV